MLVKAAAAPGSRCSRAPTNTSTARESALLEAIDGRYPFPRIAPPFRRGVERVAIRSPGEASGR